MKTTTPLPGGEGKGGRACEGANTNHEGTRRDTNYEQEEMERTKREKRPLTLALSRGEREEF
jgi:hypothetical protein